MPTPLDKRFRDDKRTLIFRAVRTIIRRSALLAKIKTFRCWEGKDDDDAKAPTVDQCPWIRITPGNAEVSLFTEVSNRTPVAIDIEFAVEGTNIDNLMNLWGCIEDSFARHADSPTEGSTVYHYLANTPSDHQGVYEQAVRYAGLSPKVSPGMLMGTGRILMNMTKVS